MSTGRREEAWTKLTEPVRSGSERHGLSAKLERVELGDEDPGSRSPGCSEGSNEHEVEADKNLVRRIGPSLGDGDNACKKVKARARSGRVRR